MKKTAFEEKGAAHEGEDACDLSSIAKIYTNIEYTEFTYRTGFPKIRGNSSCRNHHRESAKTDGLAQCRFEIPSMMPG